MSRTPDAERPIEVALLGYGLGGASFHAPLIAGTPGMRLAAIMTRDPARRRAAHERYPDAHLVESIDELWSLAPRVELVVVTTPNDTHAPLARAALEHDAHVVVDKPFATRVSDARAVGALAAARGRLAIPFQNRRWDGDFLTVQRLLREGVLGDVFRFESRFERWRATPKPRWAADDAIARGEGIVYDIGPHLIDQALALFGPVEQVHAELDRRNPAVHGEDEAFISLRHVRGVRSHLYMSTAAAQSGARMSVWGSRGAYLKFGLDVQEDALRAGAVPGGAEWGVEPPERWGWIGMGDDRRPEPTEAGAYPAFYAAVARAIRNGAPPPVTIDDAIATLEVIDAVFGRSTA